MEIDIDNKLAWIPKTVIFEGKRISSSVEFITTNGT
jgi:hypothetical protein